MKAPESMLDTINDLMGAGRVSRLTVDCLLLSIDKQIRGSVHQDYIVEAKEYAIHRLNTHGNAGEARREAITYINKISEGVIQ